MKRRWGKGVMKNIQRKKHLMIGGFSVVLLVLMLCQIGAAFVGRQLITQANEAATMNDLYQNEYDQILLQDLALHDYVLRSSPADLYAFQAAFQRSLVILQKIELVGDADDRAAVRLMLGERERYFTAAGQLFALVDAHESTRAILFHNTMVDPLADALERQIERAVTLEHNHMVQKFAYLDTVVSLVFAILLLIFVFCLTLIFFFLGMFGRYNRQQNVMELAEREMSLIANVQLHLLPILPVVAGLELYAHSHPAQQVGGDFYTCNGHGSQQWVLTVGDVSGKGLRAALLMGMVRASIQVVVRGLLQVEPQAIVSRVNEDLYNDFTEVGMFATLFVGCYDPTTQCLTCANMGHSPVIYCPADGSARLLDANGPPIGVIPVLDVGKISVSFTPGDILVMATDGLNEAQNVDGEFFGYQRLLTLVEALRQQPAQKIGEVLFETVNRFALDCSQFDDQTVVVMKCVIPLLL